VFDVSVVETEVFSCFLLKITGTAGATQGLLRQCGSGVRPRTDRDSSASARSAIETKKDSRLTGGTSISWDLLFFVLFDSAPVFTIGAIVQCKLMRLCISKTFVY
jgi:hypothetical protein